MLEFIESLGIDWSTVVLTILSCIGTYVVIPLAKKAKEYIESQKMNKYTEMLYNAVESTVKALYEDVVKEVKGTDEWDASKIAEIKVLAMTKIKAALSTTVYKALAEANDDFDAWVQDLINAKLYDLKK